MWRLILVCPLAFGLTFEANGPETPAFLSPTYMLSRHASAFSFDEAHVRPNAGKEADKIQFGLVAKDYHGSNLKKNWFKINIVISLRWLDPRVSRLIPAGLDMVSMSTKEASNKIWMPEIVVSNRDIDQYDVISSSVSIFRSGEVLRVERDQVRVCDLFKLQEYPFDTQHLTVKIASSKYMLNEVVLVPSPVKNSSGVAEDAWGGYDLQGWDVATIEEVDGDLVKSRGVLDVTVTRNLEKYAQDHLMPTFIVITISWAVFYFPFAGPFITPRLVLSILSLLTFTRIMIKSCQPLPGAAPFNWNDLLNQQIQILIFATVVLNIFSEICFHTFGIPKIAKMINHDGKALLPCLSIFNLVIILSAGRLKWLSLAHATVFVQIVSFAALAGYIGWILYLVHADMKQKSEQQDIDGKA